MSVTFELPELKFDDLFEDEMSTSDGSFDVLKCYANTIVEVFVDPELDSFELNPKLIEIHGTPCSG